MQSKRLEDIDSELERGIFQALYRSPKQRALRRFAVAVLTLKHSLRGLLFLWPVVLGIAAVLFLTGNMLTVYLLVLLPGLAIALYINIRGVREDYQKHVEGRLIKKADLRELLLT